MEGRPVTTAPLTQPLEAFLRAAETVKAQTEVSHIPSPLLSNKPLSCDGPECKRVAEKGAIPFFFRRIFLSFFFRTEGIEAVCAGVQESLINMKRNKECLFFFFFFFFLVAILYFPLYSFLYYMLWCPHIFVNVSLQPAGPLTESSFRFGSLRTAEGVERPPHVGRESIHCPRGTAWTPLVPTPGEN